MEREDSTQKFQRPEIIRPPSEWRSYYLPLTCGCSNNTCTFCNFYGTGLRVRGVEEVKREIDTLALYVRHGLRVQGAPGIIYAIARTWDGKRVFLQDGDALVYPFAKLEEVLSYLNEAIPSIDRIATYATAQDILRRSPAELARLRDLRLGIIYMGVESGDDDVLKAVGKGVDYSQMVAAGRRVKEAGIALSVTVILGLAGTEGSERHARNTARILSDLDADYVGALVLTPVPGTPMYDSLLQGKMHLVSPFHSIVELRTILENVQLSSCFFSSMHASNYFNIRGQIPQEKERMLRELDTVLGSRDQRLLRPEFLRGM